MTSAEPTLRELLAERASVTPVPVIVGRVMMNLVLALATFVTASIIGSVLLMIAAAWLLVPMGVNVYLLFQDVERW